MLRCWWLLVNLSFGILFLGERPGVNLFLVLLRVNSCTRLDQSFLKESSWLSSHQSKCLLLGYLTVLTALIQRISYRFKICKEFSNILCLFCFYPVSFLPHLLRFQKWSVRSLVPYNLLNLYKYTCFLHPLCLGFHFRKISSKTTVKLEHSPRYKLMVNKPHSLPLHLNLPQKKTKSQMLTKWVTLLVHSFRQCCNMWSLMISLNLQFQEQAPSYLILYRVFLLVVCVFQLKLEVLKLN